MRARRKPTLKNESGQAILEYILTLFLVLVLAGIINSQLSPQGRNSMRGLWAFITNQVTAACPGCPPLTTAR